MCKIQACLLYQRAIRMVLTPVENGMCSRGKARATTCRVHSRISQRTNYFCARIVLRPVDSSVLYAAHLPFQPFHI
jgi:hypothetical protein